jgi:hypothetical protein
MPVIISSQGRPLPNPRRENGDPRPATPVAIPVVHPRNAARVQERALQEANSVNSEVGTCVG